ncbi:hypothetical protein CYMTET_29042 [Cymbomonas tetramitiformis]|uniref:Uncharacterized protein n=1 Tax=Cymbomonas tetramitiformis TaxID=36881 RepID=A0AAE0KVJ4_9CHLO|nr:hypothetical protein CYMTET_29042 [Cymbomonas tetramitiformis]
MVVANSVGRGSVLKASFAADEVCSVYFVVMTSGAATPSALQVLAGQAADGTDKWQHDPRVETLVKDSGHFDYDSGSSAQLTFVIKGLESGTAYDLHLVPQDATGNQGDMTSMTKDTADDVPPIISLFQGASFWKYKKGSDISLEYISAYDEYDGDMSAAVKITGELTTHKDMSSVMIRVSDKSGNTATAYAMCNCLTCYGKAKKGPAASSIAEQNDLMYIVDKTSHTASGKGHQDMEQDDGRVVVVNSEKAGAALKAYQRSERQGNCYCKCKETKSFVRKV